MSEVLSNQEARLFDDFGPDTYGPGYPRPIEEVSLVTSNAIHDLMKGRATKAEKKYLIGLRPGLEASLIQCAGVLLNEITDSSAETPGRVRAVDEVSNRVASIYAQGAFAHSKESTTEGIIHWVESHPKLHAGGRVATIGAVAGGAWAATKAVDVVPVVKNVAYAGGLYIMFKKFMPKDAFKTIRNKSKSQLQKSMQNRGVNRYDPTKMKEISQAQVTTERLRYVHDETNNLAAKDLKRLFSYHKVSEEIVFEDLEGELMNLMAPLPLSDSETQNRAAEILGTVGVDHLYSRLGLNPRPPHKAIRLVKNFFGKIKKDSKTEAAY